MVQTKIDSILSNQTFIFKMIFMLANIFIELYINLKKRNIISRVPTQYCITNLVLF